MAKVRDHRKESQAQEALQVVRGTDGSVLKSTYDERAKWINDRFRTSRVQREQRRAGKAPLVERVITAGVRTAAAARHAIAVAHTRPNTAVTAVFHELMHVRKQSVECVEDLSDTGLLDLGDWKANLKRGSIFVAHKYLNAMNVVFSVVATKSLRLGRIETVKLDFGSATSIRKFLVPDATPTLVQDGVRLVRTADDKVVRDGDIFGVNCTEGQKIWDGPTPSGLNATDFPDSVRAQAIRDVHGSWNFGTTVATGYIPLPMVDWRFAAKIVASIYAAAKGGLVGTIATIGLSETAGKILGIDGADLAILKQALAPNG